MATEALFRQDAYLRTCEARITRIDDAGIMLDRTVFYPLGGGQAGDTGTLTLADGTTLAIVDTRKSRHEGATPDDAVHVPGEGQAERLASLNVGDAVRAEIDWDRRFRHMRFHTASHLMCAVLPHAVDGCSITPEYARLDFVTTDPITREAVEAGIARLVAAAKPVTIGSITDEEMAARPELVRTMSVKPPTGLGSVRLVRIEDIDLQPCGGTHVANTAEVGVIRVSKIEKKTSRTRRVVLAFE